LSCYHYWTSFLKIDNQLELPFLSLSRVDTREVEASPKSLPSSSTLFNDEHEMITPCSSTNVTSFLMELDCFFFKTNSEMACSLVFSDQDGECEIRCPRLMYSTCRNMALYLTIVQTILEKRENATFLEKRLRGISVFLLNEKQSAHLWRVVRVVHNYFKSSLQLPGPCIKRHKYLPDILKEFCAIVARADALVDDLFGCEQSWLQAAVFQGSHRRVFEALILDLKACVRLFHDSTGHPISVTDSATIWRFELLDSQLDAANLRVTLEELLARPALGEQERLLAQYLLEREKSSDCQDESIPRFYSVKCGYPDSGKHIGHGAFGAVYAVKWLGMHCAKKHFSSPKDENAVKEILREVSVLATLNHPHIVKLLCTSDDDSEVSFVMELMPMSLSAFIEERWKASPGGMAPAAAVDIMLQMALGMEYLHGQDIVHRDLKSSNVLVAPSGIPQLRDDGYAYVKLIDFGLAKVKVRDLMNPTQEMMGSSRWRAPEAFAADQPIDWKKADAYSFGMTCSEVLTGMTPFNSGPLARLRARILGGERPKLPSSCPEALASLLGACWHTKPCSRPSFTEIVKTLTSVKSDLLMFGLDGYDRAPEPSMSFFQRLAIRIISPAYVDPSESSKVDVQLDVMRGLLVMPPDRHDGRDVTSRWNMTKLASIFRNSSNVPEYIQTYPHILGIFQENGITKEDGGCSS
jgi:serine/threonine protein kinase